MPICRRLLMQLADLPFSFAFANAGNNIPARMAMIAMTTSSSINVKAAKIERRLLGVRLINSRLVLGADPRKRCCVVDFEILREWERPWTALDKSAETV